jgi:hypothetical protein
LKIRRERFEIGWVKNSGAEVAFGMEIARVLSDARAQLGCSSERVPRVLDAGWMGPIRYVILPPSPLSPAT